MVSIRQTYAFTKRLVGRYTRGLFGYLSCMGAEAASRFSHSAEFADVKAIVEPYWFMFNFALEYDNRPLTYALVPWMISKTGPILLTHYMCDAVQASGAAAYPSWVSQALRRGSQKYNHCDYSIRLFLRHLSGCLQKVKAGIEWLAVEAKPRLLFHWNGRPLVLKVRHSVFSITGRSGEEYVADFTVEQFGYPGSMWFMRMDEYLAQCTTLEKMEQPCPDEKASAMREEVESTRRAWIVKELCRRMDVTSWKHWNQKTRVDWMENAVRNEFWYQGCVPVTAYGKQGICILCQQDSCRLRQAVWGIRKAKKNLCG